jgi:hypothetical protein
MYSKGIELDVAVRQQAVEGGKGVSRPAAIESDLEHCMTCLNRNQNAVGLDEGNLLAGLNVVHVLLTDKDRQMQMFVTCCVSLILALNEEWA